MLQIRLNRPLQSPPLPARAHLVRVVKRWNYIASLKSGTSEVQFQQMDTLINRLEKELKQIVPRANAVCTAKAAVAKPTAPGTSATVTRANGRTQPAGAAIAIKPGDTVQVRKGRLRFADADEELSGALDRGAKLTFGDRLSKLLGASAGRPGRGRHRLLGA